MRYRWIGISALTLVLVLMGIYLHSEPQQDSRQTTSYRLVTKPCWFDAPWQQSITCAELHTPESQGEFILPVVIISDSADKHRNDPVVYLVGGPGASSRLHADGIKEWLQWMNYAHLGRDLILMDSRGTGFSKPQLQCAAFNRFNQSLLRLHLPLAEELEQSFRITRYCFDELARSPASIHPQEFGTLVSARDVRGLMSQLHYPEWNLLGVSYGTRLALEIAHQEIVSPQATRLRAMVLDSVYPASFGGVQTWPQVLDHAFQNFFTQCTTSEACLDPLQELKAMKLDSLFMATLEILQENPVNLTIRRWDGEAPINFVVNDHRFLSASFAAIYDPVTWPNITSAMYAVHHQTAEALKPLIEPYINNSFSPDFNSLAFMAVDCADNPVLAGEDYDAQVNQFPLLADYTRDQWRYQICQVFPSHPESDLTLVEPQVPTLMLSGNLDPITPVNWAKELKTRWPQLQLQIRNNVAHAVLASDDCILTHLVEFFDHPSREFDVCNQEASDNSLPE